LILLPHIPGQIFSENTRWIVYALLSLAALYGASRWFNAKDEITGRPFWLIALSAMTLASSIMGNKASVTVWAVTIIVSTTGLFLFSHRSKLLRVILLVNLIALTGLPFTPLIVGMNGLVASGFSVFSILFFLTHAVLLLGYLRHLLREGENFNELEPWMQTTYIGALVITTLTFWAATAFSTGWLILPKNWWVGIPGTVITVGVSVAALLYRKGILKFSARSNWVLAVFQRIGKILNQIFSLEWVYRLLWGVYELVGKLIRAITVILEGDGGVLWAAVLLALLFSLLWSAKG
ncbi:MAG: hypothetical protein HGA53_07125, partial [Anaerolineaceae bacterium]|nr:hypothetical protein [Anaerolineaceae bacterium]